MSNQATESMPSKPVYAPPRTDQPASRRMLVIQDATLKEAADLHEQLCETGQLLGLLSLRGEAAWLNERHGCNNPQRFEAKLSGLLGSAPAGTHLYVCGDESFLWRVSELARAAGLLEEEIELVKAGERRELYCVHCATRQSIGAEAETTCSGCSVRLMVRDHFSRRLGAYMGVCADADRPYGEERA